MERNETIKSNLEIADRLHALSDEIIGASRILMIMYENEVKNGDTAEHFLTLKNTVEGYGKEIREIAKEL